MDLRAQARLASGATTAIIVIASFFAGWNSAGLAGRVASAERAAESAAAKAEKATAEAKGLRDEIDRVDVRFGELAVELSNEDAAARVDALIDRVGRLERRVEGFGESFATKSLTVATAGGDVKVFGDGRINAKSIYLDGEAPGTFVSLDGRTLTFMGIVDGRAVTTELWAARLLLAGGTDADSMGEVYLGTRADGSSALRFARGGDTRALLAVGATGDSGFLDSNLLDRLGDSEATEPERDPGGEDDEEAAATRRRNIAEAAREMRRANRKPAKPRRP